MSSSPIPSDDSYQAYENWNNAEDQKYSNLMSQVDTMPPYEAMMAIVGFLMSYSLGQVAWTADEINVVSQCLSGVNSIQSGFDGQETGGSNINAAWTAMTGLYNMMEDFPSGSPFSSIATDVLQQLGVIVDASGQGTVTESGTQSYWYYAWYASETGNNEYVTSISNGINSLMSDFNGVSSQAQSENKYLQTNYQQFTGILHTITQAIVSQEQAMVQAMQNASS